MKKFLLVTGCGGLIGSEASIYFEKRGWHIIGIDNDMRSYFFGPAGSVKPNLNRLKSTLKNFDYFEYDIRDYKKIEEIFSKYKFSAIIHTAAQPSHDWAKKEPLCDFTVNAVGTLNLLELTKLHCPESPFLFTSTNKVYGDAPNKIPLKELDTRWEYDDKKWLNGISEDLSIDQCLHSLFGASKVAADIIVQEYGRYFNMPTVCYRGGCLTGPQHAGVELHGFLAYLVHAAKNNIQYNVYGYKAKQVRDNIHCFDVVTAFESFINDPDASAVYNLGGGKANSISMIEAINLLKDKYNLKLNWKYIEEARVGDHICYYSDLTRLKKRYPNWKISKDIYQTIDDIVKGVGK